MPQRYNCFANRKIEESDLGVKFAAHLGNLGHLVQDRIHKLERDNADLRNQHMRFLNDHQALIRDSKLSDSKLAEMTAWRDAAYQEVLRAKAQIAELERAKADPVSHTIGLLECQNGALQLVLDEVKAHNVKLEQQVADLLSRPSPDDSLEKAASALACVVHDKYYEYMGKPIQEWQALNARDKCQQALGEFSDHMCIRDHYYAELEAQAQESAIQAADDYQMLQSEYNSFQARIEGENNDLAAERKIEDTAWWAATTIQHAWQYRTYRRWWSATTIQFAWLRRQRNAAWRAGHDHKARMADLVAGFGIALSTQHSSIALAQERLQALCVQVESRSASSATSASDSDDDNDFVKIAPV